MYTEGAEVKLHGECQNTIYKIVFRKPKPAPAPQAAASAPAPQAPPATVQRGSCTTLDCNTAVEEQVVNQIIRRNAVCKDDVTGATFAPTNGQCNFAPVQGNVTMTATSTVSCGNCGNGNGPQRPTAGPAPIAQPTNGCSGSQCREQVKVTREEARTDGRCFVQTNMGYRFELRANTSTGRLMVGLVDPSTLEKIEGTRGMYVADLQASKNSKGVDCDGMQQQLYSNWETVRSAYGLPSVCTMKVAKKD